MGNKLCLKREARKDRILKERARYFVQNWSHAHLDEFNPQSISFQDAESLNTKLKLDHYEARNLNRTNPYAVILEEV